MFKRLLTILLIAPGLLCTLSTNGQDTSAVIYSPGFGLQFSSMAHPALSGVRPDGNASIAYHRSWPGESYAGNT